MRTRIPGKNGEIPVSELSSSDEESVASADAEEPSPGFFANPSEWPTWKWVLVIAGTLLLVGAAICCPLIILGVGTIAIMSAVGGAGFVAAISAGWAASVAMLTNVALMSTLGALGTLIGGAFLFIVTRDKSNVSPSGRSRTEEPESLPSSQAFGPSERDREPSQKKLVNYMLSFRQYMISTQQDKRGGVMPPLRPVKKEEGAVSSVAKGEPNKAEVLRAKDDQDPLAIQNRGPSKK